MKRFAYSLLVLALSPLAPADTSPTAGLVNYETPHVHPIDLTPDGQRLLVVNTAGHTLEVFDVSGGTPVLSARVPVGVDPVSVRARTNGEAWVVNHISDSVSIVDLTTNQVVATVLTGNEPADVVFAGNPQRAFVSCSEANRVDVFNPANLIAAPQSIPIAGEDPRALAVSPDGSTVYLAVFESGNASTAVSGGGSVNARNVVSRPEGPYAGVNPPPNDGAVFNPPIAAGLPTRPRTAMIVKKNTASQWMDDNAGDWSLFVNGAMAGLTNRQVGWDLLDHDVAVINAGNLSVSYQSRLMNMVMAIGVNPATGRVSVVGTEATNEVRFEPNLNGRFLRVNSASFPAGGGAVDIDDLNPHLNYTSSTTTSALRAQSIGDPRGIAWRANGQRAFVTGMGSNNVVVINAAGTRVGQFDVGEGPTGIVLDDATGRGYVLNKFAGSVSVIDIAAQTELSEVAFDDPTPQVIKDGRPFLYNTHLTSGLGHVSCASCHVDARTDRLSWDLGDPTGTMATVLNANNGSGNTQGTTQVHPMKGPMLTQSLQDIMGFSTLHWRGDRDNLAEFNPAFQGLQGAPQQLTATQMQQLGDFLATIHLPPNPYRNIDNTRPATVTLPSGFVATTTTANTLRSCMGCHMNGEQRNDASNQELSQAFVAPAWSPLYDRLGFWPSLQTGSTTGFGFFHDGADDIHGAARTNTAQSRTDMLAELMTLEGPDGLLQGGERRQDAHAGVGQQVTLLGGVSAAQSARVNELRSIANASAHAEFIARGHFGGAQRGFRLISGTNFQSDSVGQSVTLNQLIASAAGGEAMTFTVVANGMGQRLALDEDLDGILNFDENAPPVLAGIGAQTGTDGVALSLSLSATDPDGDALVFSVAGLPGGLGLVGNTISGTPNAEGAFTVAVTVGDGQGGSDSETFVWTIDEAPPNLAFGGVVPQWPTRVEAEHYDTGGAGVSYFDNDSGNAGGEFRNDDVDIENSQDTNGTPSVGWSGDGEWLNYTVAVSPGNYRFVARAASPLGQPGSLRVLLDGQLLTTIDIGTTGDWLTWQSFTSPSVNVAAAGTLVLRLEFVGDDFNLNWLEVIDGDGTINDPPTLTSIANQTGTVGTADSLVLSATDPNGDPLTFSTSALPPGLVLSGNTISGTPQTAGTFPVAVTVSDGNGGSDSDNFTWTISPAGGGGLAFGGVAPVLPARLQAENYDTGGAGVSYFDNDLGNNGGVYRGDDVDIEDSNDADGTPGVGWAESGEWLQYSVEAVPGNYRIAARSATPFTNPGALRVLLDGALLTTINVGQTGDWYAWQNFLSAPFAMTASGPATLRVEFTGEESNLNWIEVIPAGGDINIPPALAAIGNQTGTVDEADSLTLSATDPNGDPLTFTANGLPVGLALSGNTISGTPTASGVSTVTVTVSDGRGGTDSEIFTWTVAPTGGGGLAFGGVPPTLPTRIEAEHYDTGGAGISYFDNNAENVGETFRNDGVDIEDSQDVDGTPSVGWAENGEWMNYTVQLTPGNYWITARAASELSDPGALRVLLDGTQIALIDVADTGGWYTWQNSSAIPVAVNGSGLATLRLEIVGSEFNLNWIEFTPQTGLLGANTGGGSGEFESPGLDADGDGRVALMEYALGTSDDDGVLGTVGLSIEPDGDEALAGVVLLPVVQSDITYSIEISEDGEQWDILDRSPTVTHFESGHYSLRFADLAGRAAGSVGIELGYARLKVTHNGSGAAAHGPVKSWYQVELRNGYSSLGIAVTKPAIFAGEIDAVNAAAGSVTVGVTDANSLVSDGDFYLQIEAGADIGHRIEIDEAGSDSSDLVLLPDHEHSTLSVLPADLTGTKVSLRAHHYLGEVLPPRHFESGLDPEAADQVSFFDDGEFVSAFASDFLGEPRWAMTDDDAIENIGDRVLEPGAGLFVSRSGAAIGLVVSGELRRGWFARPLEPGYNLIAGARPEASSPKDWLMDFEKGGFLGAVDALGADQFQLWAPDSGAEVDGYDSFFLLDLGEGSGFQHWTSATDEELLSVDDDELFAPGRVVFIELRGEGFPSFRYPLEP